MRKVVLIVAQDATAAPVEVVGIGTAVVEAALLPAIVLAATVWLLTSPKVGRTLRPLFKRLFGALTSKNARWSPNLDLQRDKPPGMRVNDILLASFASTSEVS
jgi:hypothetical protein